MAFLQFCSVYPSRLRGNDKQIENKRIKKRFLTLSLIGCFLVYAFVFQVQASQGVSLTSFAKHLRFMEEKHCIPKGLLGAISKVESGRYHAGHKSSLPWPWTICVEGEGRFFPTKREAIEAVRHFRAKGIKNIDVGLMQINLLHHPRAFSCLEEAFDPQKNIEYAAKFLTALKREHSTWSQAVAHYHSALPHHHIPYRHKVYHMWQADKRQGFLRGESEGFSSPPSSLEGKETSVPRLKVVQVGEGERTFSHIRIVRKNPSKNNISSSLASERLHHHFRFIKPQRKKL